MDAKDRDGMAAASDTANDIVKTPSIKTPSPTSLSANSSPQHQPKSPTMTMMTDIGLSRNKRDMTPQSLLKTFSRLSTVR